MRQALESNDFRLWYQPIVNLATREVVAFEALLRWEHPERGLISPADFVPVAEETGLIVPLGAWVLKEACREAMAWPEHIKVSVNLSAIQFRNNAPAFDVAAALARSNLAPRRLEVEITETVMLHDTEATLETLRQIKALGVTIAMDDFGTGYSSLGFLRRFPFDKIKIDQTFVRGMCDNEESHAIVHAVTGLARSLGMTTTAEGVETAELLQALNAEGCTEAQGYYFSRPVPADKVADVLATIRQSLRAA
jgi:EAL domain-containing protein (putative c-di-GMP-specific phosphodiesterase class I)